MVKFQGVIAMEGRSNIGLKIRNIRIHDYKENSRDFAKRCGISKSCLLQMERGEVIKPKIATIKKIENALNIDLSKTNTNGIYIFKKSQKKKRFENVLCRICKDIEHELNLLDSLQNEELFLRDDELLDASLDALIQRIEKKRKELKSTCILTKEDKAYLMIDHMFKKNEVEVFPPRKNEANPRGEK